MAQPDYVAYDTKQREEFLSQSGTFNPGERDLFHKLCQGWQIRIPYNRFAPHLNREGGGTTGELVSLLNKLKAERIGLLRTGIQDGQRVREAIILAAPASPRFYYELIDEYFVDLMESIVNPLPLASNIVEDHGEIPADAVEIVTPETLAGYFSREPDGERALSIPSADGDHLLVTHKNLRTLMNVAILKLRYYLSNTTLLGVLAKLLDTSLIALKQKIAGKEPPFWLGLTRSIGEKRREIEALRNVSVDRNFYHAAWILRSLIESQMVDAAEKKKEAENRQVDLEAVALAVKDAPEGWLEQAALTELIERHKERYGDAFESFREEFYERYVQARGKNSLPKVVQLDTHYIHRDLIYPQFLAHFKFVAGELHDTFVVRMEEQLRTGNRSGDTSFYSAENFNAAVFDAVQSRSELLAKLIEKPVVLAEALILHAKQNKLVKDVDELKARLALYFDPDSMKPLPLYEWFNLRLLGIFEQAFERLPILKRIWIRLTGKYESFRGRFLGEGRTSATGEQLTASAKRGSATDAKAGAQPSARPARNAERPADRSATPRTGGRRERGASGGSDPASRRPSTPSRSGASARAAGPQQDKNYSKKQVDSAWQQFGSSVKKRD